LGENPFQAAVKGANEIYFAALSSTIAVVAIFLPVVFMSGVIGKYFAQFGLTVTVAVLLSLLEAVTLTPMRCSRYLSIQEEGKGFAGAVDRVFHKLAQSYRKWLEVCLTHRWKTLLVSLLFFASGFLVMRQVPGEMMPAQDQSLMLIRVKLPVGSAMEVTNEKIQLAEKYILAQKEVEGLFAAVGGFGGDAVNQAILFCTLVPKNQRPLSQQEVINKFRKGLKAIPEMKGVELVVQDLSLRGFAASRGFPIEFLIQGPNWEKLTEISKEAISKLQASGFVTDVNTDIQNNMSEVQIVPDRTKLAARGVALNTVTGVINALVGGAILNGKTMYPKDNHRYAIEARLFSKQRDKVPDLDRIKLRNNRGEVVRLKDVVNVEMHPSLQLISRLNRQRAITIFANPAPGTSQQEAMTKTEALVKSILPQGYSWQITGSSKSFKESFQSLGVAMALGLLVSYLVLASQFNSFIHPVTVFMALPFSFTGAFFGLYLFHQSVNMYSFIGFILLMGIVKKNSILLVDYTNQVRATGLDVKKALLEACPVRLRPILMTSVATVAGALPEALDLGPGSETTIPMSIAIIGGVIASSLLTLFVVPCVYSLLSYLERPDSLDTPVAATTSVPVS